MIKELENIKIELEKLENKYDELKIKHSIIDKIILDVEHEIGLDPADGKRMLWKYKELKQFLQLRWKIRDEIQLLDLIRPQLNLGVLYKLENNQIELEKKLENRTYTKRITQEIRENILK